MANYNYKPLYEDTDSVYINNDITTKQYLNSIYGKQVNGEKYMNREYISVIVDGKPTVIFKRNIVAVTKDGHFTDISCTSGYNFLTTEDYASVVKKIIG